MPPLPADAGSLATLLVRSNVIALALAENETLTFANAAFCRLLGRDGDLAGMPFLDLFVAPERERVDTALQACGKPEAACVAAVVRPDGSIIDLELRFDAVALPDLTLLAIFAQDVTERSRVNAQLDLLAYSDPLTRLANRAMFHDRVLQAALATRRSGGLFAVLTLDLDGFKAISDQHGREGGTAILQRIGNRLLACLRETDTVARLGGDEFAVLMPSLKTRATAAAVAQRLIEAVRQPVALPSNEVALDASVGIAIFPEHANAVDELVAAANLALYAAKRQGRGRFVWAAPASSADAVALPIQWGIDHEVGIKEIDEQHANLAARLNDLGRAMRTGEDPLPAFREVIRYTGFHFAAEERLMQDSNYAGIEAHRDMHRQLLGDMRGLRLRDDRVSVSLLLRFLQEWLLRHVDGADRDLADALHAQKERPPRW